MAVSFDVDTQAALAAGRAVRRSMVLFDFATGLYGFHSGRGTFDYNSVTYVGAGSLLSVGTLQQGSNLEAKRLVLNVDPHLEEELGPNVLTSIEDEEYHRRPVVFYTAFHDPITMALLSVEVFYEGILDQAVHQGELGKDDNIAVHIISRFFDHKKSGHRIRSDKDQLLIDDSDNGLRHVSIIWMDESEFGQETPEKKFGLLGLRKREPRRKRTGSEWFNN